jgi:predicted neuraminidase
VHFERSTDGGVTWFNTPPLNDGTKLGAIQPSLLFRDGDPTGTHLEAVGRTRQKKVFTISSSDGGKTWGKMSLLEVPNPSAGTDAVTLRDGRHLLVCNPVARGRTPLAVFVSRDGREWKQAVVLENEPGEYSYPAIIQTSDGKIHITYTWKRQRIKHVVLNPLRLEPEQPEGPTGNGR